MVISYGELLYVRPVENTSGQRDQTRLTDWVRWSVANLFAFAASSRMNRLPVKTEFAQAKDSANFGNPVVNSQHTNAWKTKKNVLNTPAIFLHVVTSFVGMKIQVRFFSFMES